MDLEVQVEEVPEVCWLWQVLELEVVEVQVWANHFPTQCLGLVLTSL